MNTNPPPRLDLGGRTNTVNTASLAIGDRLDAIDRERNIQRTVMDDFALTLDKLVGSYKHQEHRAYAQDIVQQVIKYVTTSVFAANAPSGTPPSSLPKSVSFGRPTYAGVAGSLKNSGADFHSTKTPLTSSSGRGSTSSANGGASLASSSKGSASATKSREDRRLLVPVEPTALLNRPEAFALRQELCRQIPELTLAKIPAVTPTRTGWAINPTDLATRCWRLLPDR